jgi:DNA-binding PucR family transcriptional regulator
MASTLRLRPRTASSLLEQSRRLLAADSTGADLCRALVGPLVREDNERGNNLLATLRAYYECGARVDLTADRLFLHRNSVRYRLDRIRFLLQADIDEPQTIAALMLALGGDSQTLEHSNASKCAK